jgi:hypothetical protein
MANNKGVLQRKKYVAQIRQPRFSPHLVQLAHGRGRLSWHRDDVSTLVSDDERGKHGNKEQGWTGQDAKQASINTALAMH